jgi:ABC-type uncharacterized transport system permease subunit
MNKKKSILESNVLYTIVAIIAGFLVGAIFLLIAGISPAVAYGKLFDSIFSKPKYLVWTLVYASPLIFTGLSVAFSFRTGVFNIGAEGQFVIGSLVACVLGIVLKLPEADVLPWSLSVRCLHVRRNRGSCGPSVSGTASASFLPELHRRYRCMAPVIHPAVLRKPGNW